jgi:hypothetical protein
MAGVVRRGQEFESEVGARVGYEWNNSKDKRGSVKGPCQ